MSKTWQLEDHLPPTLKVGSRIYRCLLMKDVDAARDQQFAHIDHNSREIRFAGYITWAKAAESMIHEMIHAIIYHWAISEKQDDDQFTVTNEEGMVFRLCSGLTTVMLDNPEVMQWILRGLRSDL